MSLIRIITLGTLFFLLAALPSQPTQALVPDAESQASCANVSEIPQLECEALVAFYESTDGPNWDDNTGWLATDTPCSWYGVRCGEGHVTRLNLNGQFDNPFGLQGAIPAEIGNLSSLTMLSLYSNQLSSLPAEIGSLTNLTNLWLSDNQLDSLPTQLWTLNNLISLWLSANQLSSLPAEVGNLDNLTKLRLSGNLFDTLPAEIGRLNNLTELRLSDNELNSLPPEIGDLNSLTDLLLGNTPLTNLPAEIGNLDNLGYLYLGNNRLNSVPAEIGNLTRLTELDLHSNSLSSLPAEIGNLNNLTRLSLYSNQLSSLPAEIGDLNNLTGLTLDINQLTSLPTSFANLTNITTLNLAQNYLAITVTDEALLAWMNRHDPDWADRQKTRIQFSCTNVSEISQLECEALVALYENTGGPNWDNTAGWLATDTPCSWYGVTCEAGNVNKLVLDGTSDNPFGLQGALPAQIGNLNNLKSLSLYDNQLTSLPTTIGNLDNLTELRLSGNQLSSLPAEIGDLNNLNYLYLDSNRLESLPAEIGNLNNLLYLFLIENQLTNLPAQIGSLDSLTNLRLQNNQLNSLPAEIGNLSKLIILRLSDNQLNRLPAEIGKLNNLDDLWLEYNQLTSLPTSFVNLTNMMTLNLEQNRLTVTDAALRTWMNTHDPDWADTQNLDTSTPSPTTPQPTAAHTNTAQPAKTPTPAVTPTPNNGTANNDESNNSCNTAQSITTNGIPHDHAFQERGDVDWGKFDVTAGTTYRIEVIVPAESDADVNLELYPDCDSDADKSWSESFSPSVRLDFEASSDGTIYLKLLNQRSSVFGSKTAYQLSVRPLTDDSGNRALIIVAGRQWEDDPLQRNIHYVTDQVYRTFLDYNYEAQDIKYLATDSDLTGYTGAADLQNLRVAITDWAAEQLDGGGVLNLYMIDHGHVDKLYIDREADQVLTPTDLDSWLSELESQIDDLTINVIIEACQSGSFISPDGGSISRPGRVVITSTDDVNDAKASFEGAQFTDQFMAWLHRGYNIAASFGEARSAAKKVFPYQEPWIDSNGNGLPNEFEDVAAASQRGFNFGGTFASDNWPPHIFSVEPPTALTNFNGTIYADVRDDENVELAWAVIYPPSYILPETSNALQAELSDQVTKIILDPQPNLTGIHSLEQGTRYGGSYNFVEEGTYRVIVYAKDRKGLNARPIEVEFNVAQGGQVSSVSSNYLLYLPLIQR